MAPGFVFTDETGARKTSEDYRGKLTLYNFTYTGCGDGCPQTSKSRQALREQLSQSAAPDVHFAQVTAGPKRVAIPLFEALPSVRAAPKK